MTKSSESEQARRVNATLSLLKKKVSPQETLDWLVTHYGISRRQAYRYVRQAKSTPGPVAVPEPKNVFTVKLSASLIREVRQHARRQDSTISQWVEAALRRSLKLPRGHG